MVVVGWLVSGLGWLVRLFIYAIEGWRLAGLGLSIYLSME